MKMPFTIIQPQYYLSDSAGKKRSVVFDIQTWQEFTEELEDLVLGLVAKHELESASDTDFVAHEEVVKKIQKKLRKTRKK